MSGQDGQFDPEKRDPSEQSGSSMLSAEASLSIPDALAYAASEITDSSLSAMRDSDDDDRQSRSVLEFCQPRPSAARSKRVDAFEIRRPRSCSPPECRAGNWESRPSTRLRSAAWEQWAIER